MRPLSHSNHFRHRHLSCEGSMQSDLDGRPTAFRSPTGLPVPILTYHSLDETGSVISISPRIFQAQMRALHDQGFQAIRLIDLLNAWERGEIPCHRPVV